MLTSLANLSICSGVNPVYANMPIWLVIWLQSCLDPKFSNSFFNKALMVMIRSAIPFTSPNHCLFNAGSLRILEAIRAPWTGGLEYKGRTRILICESTRFFSAASAQTIEKAPTRSPYRPFVELVSHDQERMYRCTYHVLSERLGETWVVALLDKVTKGVSISVSVS